MSVPQGKRSVHQPAWIHQPLPVDERTRPGLDDLDRTPTASHGAPQGASADVAGSMAAAGVQQPLPIGTLIKGFRITGLIGEGGFGIVYRAWDDTLERHVAIKEYMPESLAVRATGSFQLSLRSERHRGTFRAGLASFLNEARLLARFEHPALVKVFRFWEANNTAYMVMPYYEGPTLKIAIDLMGVPPPEEMLRDWLLPLLDALTVLHRQSCYHRDIAPDNILLTHTGPLLLDLGAARHVIGDLAQTVTVVLKPGYAPIEQYGGGDTFQGPWTDLYALAGVVRYAITGRTPQPAVERIVHDKMPPLAQTHAGQYSDAFLRAIDAALQIKPEQRVQDVAQFRELLNEGLPPDSPLRFRPSGFQHSAFMDTVLGVPPAMPAKPEPSGVRAAPVSRWLEPRTQQMVSAGPDAPSNASAPAALGPEASDPLAQVAPGAQREPGSLAPRAGSAVPWTVGVAALLLVAAALIWWMLPRESALPGLAGARPEPAFVAGQSPEPAPVPTASTQAVPAAPAAVTQPAAPATTAKQPEAVAGIDDERPSTDDRTSAVDRPPARAPKAQPVRNAASAAKTAPVAKAATEAEPAAKAVAQESSTPESTPVAATVTPAAVAGSSAGPSAKAPPPARSTAAAQPSERAHSASGTHDATASTTRMDDVVPTPHERALARSRAAPPARARALRVPEPDLPSEPLAVAAYPARARRAATPLPGAETAFAERESAAATAAARQRPARCAEIVRRASLPLQPLAPDDAIYLRRECQ